MNAERLREVIDYDKTTGFFTWRIHRGSAGGKTQKGMTCGSLTRFGYWCIRVDGKLYMAHRLAWLYATEEWPKDQIDHIDGNKLNNSIVNLRQATNQQNHFNVAAKGYAIVGGLRKKRFNARLTINGKLKSLGYFETSEQAHAVYVTGSLKLLGSEFSNRKVSSL